MTRRWFGRVVVVTSVAWSLVGCGEGDVVAGRTGALLSATEEFRTATSDARMNSYVGVVDLDGDTLVVGVPTALTGPGGSTGGAVHVYVRGGAGWALQQRLVSSDIDGGDQFGAAVSLDGDTLVVGAPYRDATAGMESGAAYVFTRSGVVWTERTRFESPAATAAAGDHFGGAVATRGGVIVVGAPEASRAGRSSSGDAHVLTLAAGVVTHEATLAADDPAANDHFGQDVATDGTRVVVGSASSATFPGPIYNPAAAYVFIDGATGWTLEARLRASTTMYGSGDAVAIGAGYVAATAPSDRVGGVARGTVHVWRRDGGGFTELPVVIPTATGAFDLLGLGPGSLAFDGSRLVVTATNATVGGVGAAGTFYVLDRTGDTFSEELLFTPPPPVTADSLGGFVALEGDRVAVSAGLADTTAGTNSGLVRVLLLATVTTPDAGAPALDAGTDAGDPGTDAGDPSIDAGDPGTDAGDPGTDAGPTSIDAGTAEDAGGPSTSDAGSARDAATPRPDASTPRDAGTTARDVGTAIGPVREDGGCGCRTVAPRNARPNAALTLALLTLLGVLVRFARPRRRD